jgi:hypothetical protein
MKSLIFTAILSLRKRSEQLLIKFAILLQIGLTHAQTFFRGVPADICLGGGFEIDVLATAIMKRFEQISGNRSMFRAPI